MWYKDKKDFDNNLSKNIQIIDNKEQLIIPPLVYEDIKTWNDFKIINEKPYYKNYPVCVMTGEELIGLYLLGVIK